jgi:hypothetical protein
MPVNKFYNCPRKTRKARKYLLMGSKSSGHYQ